VAQVAARAEETKLRTRARWRSVWGERFSAEGIAPAPLRLS